MPSTYSPDLRIELIGTGDQAGVWGATTNNNLAYVLEQSIAGYVSVSVTTANQAFTYINGGSSVAADNQSVHASLALTTTTTADFAVYAPPASKQYTIYNASSYVATIYNSTVIGNTTAAGTGVAIPAGKTMTVWSDGTNFAQQNTHLIAPTVTGGTFTSPSLVTPAFSGETYSTSATVTAGTDAQGQGALTSDINVVTTAAANPSGVTLPTATTGRIVAVVNKGANPINVYPATGGYIDALTINTSIQIPANSSLQFIASSTTQWYSSATGNTGSGAAVRAVSPAFTGTPTAPTAAVGTNTTQIATTAFVQAAGLTGEIKMWGNATAPTGYLLCDGQAISRTTYAALFAVYGTTFGAGDGSTTFNVPNFTNRMPIGVGSTAALAATGGSADAIVVSHTHTATDSGHTHSTPGQVGGFFNYSGGGGTSGVGTPYTANGTTGTGNANISVSTTGSSGTGANLPPYLGIYYIIKT